MAENKFAIAPEFRGLAILTAVYIVNAMDRTVFATLLPNVAADFGFPLAVGGFLATIFTLGLGVAGLPSGYLLDRISRKAVAIIGICIYSICTLLTCLSVGVYDMAAYRIVSGAGEGLQIAATFTMVGSQFRHDRGLAFGVLNLAFGIGAFLGPWWGGRLLAQSGDWRIPLLVYGMLGLAGALAILLLVPLQFSERQHRASSAEPNADGHVPERLFNRNTIIVTLVAVSIGVVGYGYLGLYPTFLRTRLAFSPEAVGLVAGMFGVGALLGPAFGYLADRVDQKWMTIAALSALAVNGYALFHIVTSPLWQGACSFLQGAVLSGCLFVNAYSLMQRSARAARTGRASGLFVTSLYGSAAFSGYLFARLVDAFGWERASLAQMSLLLAMPVLAMAFFDLKRTDRQLARGSDADRRFWTKT